MWRKAIQDLADRICGLGLNADEMLEHQKSVYIRAKDEIDRLRDEIAMRDCPLKIGDRVWVQEGDKRFEGQVEYVVGVASPDELLGPETGVKSGWSAGGRRYKSTTGELSEVWTFAVVSFEYVLEGGVWIRRERGIEATLGLSRLP